MDLLTSYKDDDDQNEEAEQGETMEEDPASSSASPPHISLPSKSAAPKIDETALTLTSAITSRNLQHPIHPTQHSISTFNPTYDQLWAPLYGPSHPYAKDGVAQGMRNHKLGFVEDAAIQPFLFDEQYNTFHTYGYASDPSGLAYVGDLDTLDKNKALSVYNIPQQEQKRRKMQMKDADNSVVITEEADNPASEEWLRKNKKSPWSGKKEVVQGELTEEQKKYAEEHAIKKAEKDKEGKGESKLNEFVDKTTFHGKEEYDYQGRSWIQPPKDAKATNDHCYIPKRLEHTWSGHTKGVSAIRFFPKYGHLLLSASMDTKIKIWDVFNSRQCMRTYMGHSKAVRDISFSNDGSRFLSAGYDKNIKLWDTETGKVISTFSTGKIPYVVKLNPDADKQNILLAGMSDKKIVQWDMNSGEITQEYDQHLGAVNTITFVDNNRRFVTSSDDKSLRVWEFGIPVVIKYISEPHMHSMPSISLHPNSNWLAAQSLDNQILIYSTKERFQLNKKKRFAGHISAGYACQVNFSPDGRFVMSGDGEGKCWFWDWKSCKVFKTLRCHQGVCIGCEWHPLEQSKVATCGWDGAIHYWD